MSDRVAAPPRDIGLTRPVERGQTGRETSPSELQQTPPETRPARKPDPLYHLVLLALSAAVLVLAAVLSIRSQTQVLIPLTSIPLPELCLTRRWMGFGCPGCGMTRCFISLARGDLVAAWSYNPAGLLMFAVVAAQIPLRTVQLWRIQRGLSELTWGLVPQLVLGAVAAIMVVQWMLRLCGLEW
jgi:hypothetical protein